MSWDKDQNWDSLLGSFNDEVTIERRKKEFGIGKDKFHWNGFPLDESDLELLAAILKRAVKDYHSFDF